MPKTGRHIVTVAADVVAKGKKYLGVKENPVGSNKTPIGVAYGWNGVAWCHEYVSLIAYQAGMTKNVDFPWTASTPVGKSWFQSKNRWYQTPQAGDFVYYSTAGKNGSPYHVELVTNVTATTIHTYGGNTSGTAPSGSVSGSGDGCYEKTLSRSLARISGYGRPFYTSASTATGDDVPTYISIDKNSKSTPQALARGVWSQITFNQNNGAAAAANHSSGDYPSVCNGPKHFQGTVYLTVSGLPVGTEGQVRAVYADAKTNAVTTLCAISEFSGTSGDTFIEKSLTGRVPNGQKLRIEVIQYGADATATPAVVGGQVRLMVWDA